MYKIGLQRYFFWNLQQMGKVTRLFCWHQDFVHKGLSAPASGLYTCGKTLKMCIKSEFKEVCLKLATNGQSDKGFLLTSKVCPQGVFLPLSRGYIQATPAMSTLRILILSLMSKWFFIPNIFSLYIFAVQLRLCRKRLTWSNGYVEVIFHALDVFSIIFATFYVEVKNRCSHGCRTVCFGYVHVLSEVRKSSKRKSKTIKVIYCLSIVQLILYLVQLNPWLFWYEIKLYTDKVTTLIIS